ncbi:MAG: MATE family efflux transporter [Treponema sp.]|jgi:Na+-driven multidrug efflux pump|nr:MATE family efflux transporter [Treponema sp.]
MQQELNEQERTIFVEIPPAKAVVTLAFPTIISQVITVIYNLADTYFVGRTNNPAMVAAIALCMPLMLIITSLANLFGIGGSSLIARCLGNNDFIKARKVSAFAVWGGVAIITVYSLLLFLLKLPALSLLGATGDTFGYCYSYMLWVCIIGSLPAVMNVLLAQLIRSEGAAKEASLGMSLGGILNIALDPLFMFVILPDGQAVAGAAIATMISNLAASSCFIVYIIRHRKDSVLSLNPRDLSLHEHIPGDIIAIGLPSFLMTMLSSVSNAVANNLISNASAAAVAGIGIAKKINMLSFRVSTGITQGALPLIAYNHSAENFRRMEKSILSAAGLAVGFAVICMGVSFTFGSHFVRFFIADSATINFGGHFIRIICLAMPLASLSMTVVMFFQATARKVPATLLSVLRKGILDVPLMFILNNVWPVYGVACATPIAEVISCVTAVILMRVFFNRIKMHRQH